MLTDDERRHQVYEQCCEPYDAITRSLSDFLVYELLGKQQCLDFYNKANLRPSLKLFLEGGSEEELSDRLIELRDIEDDLGVAIDEAK